MMKRNEQKTPNAAYKRNLSTLTASTRCGDTEKNEVISSYARRCTTASLSQSLRHYA